jgi:hypothetical protein
MDKGWPATRKSPFFTVTSLLSTDHDAPAANHDSRSTPHFTQEVFMSLTGKRPSTAKRIAASQANGRRSRGPTTPQGRERLHDAHIRHGLYSPAEGVAIKSLGEDPAELEVLRANLHDGLQVLDTLGAELAEHLTQVIWRWRRSSRQQEGLALRLARQANLTRGDRQHARMMRLKMTEESLRLLAQSAGREYAGPGHEPRHARPGGSRARDV